MTPAAKKLDEQLQQTLAAWPLFQQGEAILTVEQDGNRITCVLTALDSLACAFTSLSLQSDRLAGASIERLKAVAGNLAKRLTYLLEPINPIETDIDRCIVQMRSLPPKQQADQIDYYELLVARSGELALVRYSARRAPSGCRSRPRSRAKCCCGWRPIWPALPADSARQAGSAGRRRNRAGRRPCGRGQLAGRQFPGPIGLALGLEAGHFDRLALKFPAGLPGVKRHFDDDPAFDSGDLDGPQRWHGEFPVVNLWWR